MIVGVAVTIPGRPLAGGGAAPPATPINIIQSVPVLQWCRSDLGITLATGVSGWADQSGNGNHYSQATGANQPAYNAVDATLNNRPTLVSGNTGNKRLTCTSLVLAPPFFIICVWKSNISGVNVVHRGSPLSGNGASLFIADAGANIYTNNGGSVFYGAALPTSTWCRSLENYANSAADYVSIAGRSKQAGTNAGNASSVNGFEIGGQPGFAGDITFAEIIICAGEPTALELTAIDVYLAALYGIGVVVGNPNSIFGNSVTLSTLQWCRADRGVTGLSTVSAWADQSGNGKDYTQATGLNQPARIGSDPTLNNLQTIAFDGTNDNLQAALDLPQPSAGTPTCVLLIGKLGNYVSQGVVVGQPGNTGNQCVLTHTGLTQLTSASPTGVNAVITPNVWNRIRADYSNSAGDVFKNGASAVTGNAGNQVPQIGRALGAFANGSFAAPLTAFEVVYLSKLPTAAEIANYDKYVTATTAGMAGV